MIKVLIVCKNNSNAKLLVNNVTGKIHNLHLIGIANTINEGLTLLKKRDVDSTYKLEICGTFGVEGLKDRWYMDDNVNYPHSNNLTVEIDNPYTDFSYCGVGIKLSYDYATFNDYDYLKIRAVRGASNLGGTEYRDILVFKKKHLHYTTIYFSINDKNNDLVYSQDTETGLYVLNKKVKLNMTENGREVESDDWFKAK